MKFEEPHELQMLRVALTTLVEKRAVSVNEVERKLMIASINDFVITAIDSLNQQRLEKMEDFRNIDISSLTQRLTINLFWLKQYEIWNSLLKK
jgi:hypothetical protein